MDETTKEWSSKRQELMKDVGIVIENIVISDMFKDIVPKDTQDQTDDDDVTIEYHDGVNAPVIMWLRKMRGMRDTTNMC